MTKLGGVVRSWIYGLALVGVWAGCTGRTDIGVGPDEGSGGEGLSSPQAGSGGGAIDGEGGGSPEGGTSGSSAGSRAAAGGDLAGGNGGSTMSGGNGGSTASGGNGATSGSSGDSGSTGTGGTTSGGTDAGGTTAGGTDAGGTTSGGTDAGGTTSGGTDAGGTDAGGSGAQAGTAGAAGSAGSPPDLTIVKPTAGCGLSAPSDLVVQQYVGRTIETAGHKENSDVALWCHPGKPATYDWSYTREYSVRLPTGYDPAKAYPVVLQGSCWNTVDPVADIAEQVIHVFFAPKANDCPSRDNRCYDTDDGDNSSEFPFYESVWQRLSSELCFDQNRVFTTGWFGGGRWANELGCRYAGHAKYPIRAIGVGDAGLTNPPTCSGSPLAALWLRSINRWTDHKSECAKGVTAALLGNGCLGSIPPREGWTNYAVPGLNDGTCQNIASGCSASASNPLVECGYGNEGPRETPAEIVAALGLAHFFSSFFAP